MKIYTIGHSVRTFQEFVNMLKHYGIETVIDVRHFPSSRYNPQFNKDNLEKALPKVGIRYKWIEKLGGYRTGGYKAFTKTFEFEDGLKELKKIKGINVIMCAESLWFKCHRRYIADFLKRQGYNVLHIYDENKIRKHLITKKSKIKCDKQKKISNFSFLHKVL